MKLLGNVGARYSAKYWGRIVIRFSSVDRGSERLSPAKGQCGIEAETQLSRNTVRKDPSMSELWPS